MQLELIDAWAQMQEALPCNDSGRHTNLSVGIISVSGNMNDSGDPATAGVKSACRVDQPCMANKVQLTIAGIELRTATACSAFAWTRPNQ